MDCLFSLFFCLFLLIHGFFIHSHVYTRVFLEQSCMYTLLSRTIMYALFFILSGRIKCCWVSSVDCWVFLDAYQCLYTPYVSNQRLLLVYFLSFVLVIHLSIFCFEISALGFFFLITLLGCCLWVVANSEGGREIFLLFYLK